MKNKVLVAMGIGIFAALTFNAASVTTLAEEGPDPVEPNNNEQKDNTLADEAVKAAETASTVLNKAAETVTGEDGTNEAEANLEQKADEVLGEDPNVHKDPITKAEDVYDTTSLNEKKDEAGNVKFEQGEAGQLNDELTDGDWTGDYAKAIEGKEVDDKDKSKTPVSGSLDFNTPLEDISAENTGKLAQMENLDTLAAGKANEISNKAGEIDAKVDEADKLVKEANGLLPDDDIVAKANAVVDQASKTIAGATTPEEVDDALALANKAVEDVNTEIDAANNRMAEIDSELATLKSNYDGLIGEYNDKVAELKDYEAKFLDLKAIAESDATAVEAERARLEKEAKELYDASVAAKNAYDERRYKELQDQENILKTSLKGMNRQQKLEAYRTFVFYVMKNYYVPDVLGGEMTDDLNTFINDEEFNNDKSKWQAPDGKYTYTDADGNTYTSTEGDVLRYGTINYKLKGSDEVKQMRVNYKTSNANNLFGDVDFPGLVIFEKTEHQMIRLENGVEIEITDVLKDAINENGYYIDGNGTIFGKDANGNIIRYGAGTSKEGFVPEDEIDNVDDLSLKAGESKKDVTVGEEQVSYRYENGKVIKTITAEVTVKTYTGTGSGDVKLDFEDKGGNDDWRANGNNGDEKLKQKLYDLIVEKLGDSKDLISEIATKTSKGKGNSYGNAEITFNKEYVDYKLNSSKNKFVMSDISVHFEKLGNIVNELTGTEKTTYTLSTTEYSDAASTEITRYRNDNWYKGNLILSEYDYNNSDNHYVTDGKEGNATKNVKIDKDLNDDFRNKVDGVGKIPAAYEKLIEKAKASELAFKNAADEVASLQAQIAALESKHEVAKYKELTYDLTNAKARLARLSAERDELNKKLDDLKQQHDDKIEELNTPAPTVMIVGTADAVVDAPLIVDAPADDTPVLAAAPVGAVLGANRPLETLGSVRSGSVLGERRGPQGAVLGKRRSPKTADGAMGGMVAGMMLSMMSAFGGAKVLKKKHEDEE